MSDPWVTGASPGSGVLFPTGPPVAVPARPCPAPTRGTPVTTPEPYDARQGDGDPLHDPAAVGEASAEQPDADGGAVPAQEAERAAQQRD